MSIRLLGVDPGVAHLGIAAVEKRDDGVLISRGVRLVQTKPDHTKKQRVSSDDERRYRTMWSNIKEAVTLFRPQALSVECYTVYGEKDVTGMKQAGNDLVNYVLSHAKPADILATPEATMRFVKAITKLKAKLDEGSEVVGKKGRGKAAKTLAVYGIAMSVAWERNIPVFINMPIDLKLKFVGRASASKAEVAQALRGLVVDLESQVNAKVTASNAEHVYDAAGHAVLGIRHVEELYTNAGVTSMNIGT